MSFEHVALEGIKITASSILETAMGILRRNGSLAPVAFFQVRKGALFESMPSLSPPLPLDLSNKDLAVIVIQAAARVIGAEAVFFVSDCWTWEMLTKEDAGWQEDFETFEDFCAAFDRMDHEQREKYTARQEAVQVVADSRWGKVLVAQKYARNGEEVVPGEIAAIDNLGEHPKIKGRFLQLLPEDETPDNDPS